MMAVKWIKSRAWYVAKTLSFETGGERARFLDENVPAHLRVDVRQEVERQFALRTSRKGEMEAHLCTEK